MDFYQSDKYYCRSNNICCDLVVKIKQYLNILHYESNRLGSLQTECNQLLDQFYALKDEFHFLLRESLPIKYLGSDDKLSPEEYVKEFSMFTMNVWQIGKHRFSEKGKKAQYLCFVGKLLSEVTSTINSFVDEVSYRFNYITFHAECTATVHTICNQINSELQGDCLGSAEACLRQYVYLQEATPFLQELNGLIHQYLLLPNIHTSQHFLDRVILKIPPIEELLLKEDTQDTKPFRFVVNLLNGKLLGNDILEQNSDLRPVVEHDTNFKRSKAVMTTVEWITQQYKVNDVPMLAKNIMTDVSDKNKLSFAEGGTHYRHHKQTYNAGHDDCEGFEPFDLNKIDWSAIYNSQVQFQKKYNRRGRKNGPNNIGTRMSNDLQPIKLHALQTPLLPPLL